MAEKYQVKVGSLTSRHPVDPDLTKESDLSKDPDLTNIQIMLPNQFLHKKNNHVDLEIAQRSGSRLSGVRFFPTLIQTCLSFGFGKISVLVVHCLNCNSHLTSTVISALAGFPTPLVAVQA